MVMKMLAVVVFVLLMVPMVAADDLVVRKARLLDDWVSPGEGLLVHISLYNPFDYLLEDMGVTFSIPELGYQHSAGGFDIDSLDRHSQLFYVPLPPDQARGEYLMRITMRNDDVRRTVYRYVTVI